jgi:hypothetical protein
MKRETRSDDGIQYWAYVLIYFDDILCVHHESDVPHTKVDQYPSRNQPSSWAQS